jgi:tetratricopeptide (TPR) repeat protein
MEVLRMRDYIYILVTLFFVLYLFSCGSGGKKGLKIGDESPEELLEKADLSYKNGQYDYTIEYCKALIHNYPVSDLHVDAQINIAKSLGAKEKFEDQFDLLLRIINENKIPEKVPLIFVQIGEFYEHAAIWNPGNLTTDSLDLIKAAQYYRRAVFYPNSDDKVTKAYALYRAALINAKLNHIDVATRAYEHVVANFPESPYSTLAKIKLRDPSNTEEITIESETAKSLEKQRKKELEISAKEAAKEKGTEEEKVIEYPDEMTDKDKEIPPVITSPTRQDSISTEIKEEKESKQEKKESLAPPAEEAPVMEIPEE